jgi:WS/DGAT/MGAT family acyltransferase
MSRYAYDRLSAQDATFLWAEAPNQPMHIGGLAIFESGPLRRDGSGVDIDRYRSAIEGVLHWIPRYRQKLKWTPVERWPVWVDDRRFDLGYHIRHIALPRPGSHSQLKELAARIFARPLDRSHPLWEIWLIEGLEDGEQFAVLNKIHHCMMDGAAGADLSQILMSPSPRLEPREPLPYMPKPVPSAATLLRDSIGLGVRRPIEAVRGALKTRRTDDPDERPTLDRRMRAMREMLQYSLRPASSTPINGTLGPHRRLEWATMPLEHVHEIRAVFGGTINDVVLATVSEAMRCYLFRRRVDHRKIDFRIAAPVSVRRAEHDRRQGNHVSTWIVPLPVRHDDPIEQLQEVQKQTQALKESEAALAIDTMMQAAEWLPAPALSRMTGLAQGPANMIVTNVPGPQFPLYSVGARLLGMYPLVPLLPGGGLGVALFSYEGKLCWGFNADHELVPDLPTFVSDVQQAFEKLRTAAVSHFMERRTVEDTDATAESQPTPTRKKTGRRRKPSKVVTPAPTETPPERGDNDAGLTAASG